MTNDSQEPSQAPTTELEELRSLIQSQAARIESLEKFAASNRRRIQDSKALNALLVVCVPLIFITADVHFGEQWSGNFRSRDIDAGDIASILGIGAAALGVISSEQLADFIKRR